MGLRLGSLRDVMELEMKVRMVESMRDRVREDEGPPGFCGKKVEQDSGDFEFQGVDLGVKGIF